MSPLKCKTVKMQEEVRNLITKMASSIKYSENKFMIECVLGIASLIDNPGNEKLPLIVVLAREANRYHATPPPLSSPPELSPSKASPARVKKVKSHPR
jgi:hypothetical protein